MSGYSVKISFAVILMIGYGPLAGKVWFYRVVWLWFFFLNFLIIWVWFEGVKGKSKFWPPPQMWDPYSMG